MTDTQILVTVFVVLPIVVLWTAAIFHIIFRRPDLSVMWKAAWIATVLVIPTVGVFVYALLRPRATHGTSATSNAGVSHSAIEEIHGLVAAHETGTLTDDEFGRRKAEIFGLV